MADPVYPTPQVLVIVDLTSADASTNKRTSGQGSVYFVIDKVKAIENTGRVSITEYEQKIISDLSSGNFRLSRHFKNDRSESRSVTRQDIQSAACDWKDCWTEPDSRGDMVHVVGPDLDGEEFEIRAGYDGETLVITAVDAK